MSKHYSFGPVSVAPPYNAPETGSAVHLMLVLDRLVTDFRNCYGDIGSYLGRADMLFFWETVHSNLSDLEECGIDE